MGAADRVEKKRDFLVCVDSDGCALDTMEAKHRLCFGPCLIEEWNFQAERDRVLSRWNEINLYSVTRGVNRFRALALILREIDRTAGSVEGIAALEAWTESAPELSNRALESLSAVRPEPIFQKALRWSVAVNERIAALPESAGLPFPHAEETLRALHERADIAVVSSANGDAVRREWERRGLAAHADAFLTQEEGSKKACIAAMRKKGYPAGNVLMVGDAPGDLEAAEGNGVLFYPVLAGGEGESWQRLGGEGMALFLRGAYQGAYEEAQKSAFYRNLRA